MKTQKIRSFFITGRRERMRSRPALCFVRSNFGARMENYRYGRLTASRSRSGLLLSRYALFDQILERVWSPTETPPRLRGRHNIGEVEKRAARVAQWAFRPLPSVPALPARNSGMGHQQNRPGFSPACSVGDPSESRTPDTMIKSHVLYLLS